MDLIQATINAGRPHSRNVMPSALEKAVGSFIYFDHLGPFDFPAGREVYIPPHPHAGIATISYMFSGEGHHKDSLQNEQILHKGRINYMQAGKGILHSEGLSKNFSQKGGRLLGIQIWHLLSAKERNSIAKFQTYSENELGSLALSETCKGVILIGNYKATSSPIETEREMLMMAIEADDKGKTTIQFNKDWQYLLYTCDGLSTIEEYNLHTGEGVFLENTNEIQIEFMENTKAIVFGGPLLDEVPIFAGSLVAVGNEQLQSYYNRLHSGEFGVLD